MSVTHEDYCSRVVQAKALCDDKGLNYWAVVVDLLGVWMRAHGIEPDPTEAEGRAGDRKVRAAAEEAERDLEVLRVIADSPGLTPVEIARLGGFSPSRIHQKLARLEGRGKVRREEQERPRGKKGALPQRWYVVADAGRIPPC